jgi:predicted naringenin-chalcone synthase
LSFITHIGTANPPHLFKQRDIAEFMVRLLDLKDSDADHLRVLYRASGIESRHSVLEDFGSQNGTTFFSNTQNQKHFPPTQQRMAVYQREAIKISERAVANATNNNYNLKSITHLIVVSCTGMYSPGLDIDLVKRLELNSGVHRTNITFMGCYAAFSALKLAHAFCQSAQDAKVLIVCTEFCSLHLQQEPNDNNLLAGSLFSDGSAAVIVEPKPQAAINLKLESFYCDLLLNGEADMAWSVGDLGFEMKLSSYIPMILQSGIKQLIKKLLAHARLSPQDIDYYAIHPGGKKILEVIESEIGITRKQNEHGYAVLKRYGNMSSPTVLFVLKKLVDQLSASDDSRRILSLGFGPGITLESIILKIECQ